MLGDAGVLAMVVLRELTNTLGIQPRYQKGLNYFRSIVIKLKTKLDQHQGETPVNFLPELTACFPMENNTIYTPYDLSSSI